MQLAEQAPIQFYRAQFQNIVNGPDPYSLIIWLNKPEARALKRRVTHVVLSTIRKTGGYIHGDADMSEKEIRACAQNSMIEDRLNSRGTGSAGLI
jgi:prophage antirepressor-like protein